MPRQHLGLVGEPGADIPPSILIESDAPISASHRISSRSPYAPSEMHERLRV
jgi:hypothetical protein